MNQKLVDFLQTLPYRHLVEFEGTVLPFNVLAYFEQEPLIYLMPRETSIQKVEDHYEHIRASKGQYGYLSTWKKRMIFTDELVFKDRRVVPLNDFVYEILTNDE